MLIVVQARLGSSRLPRKVLRALDDRPLLQHVVDRARAAEVGDVVVAHPVGDDEVGALCTSMGVTAKAGDEFDVLSRYAEVVQGATASHVIRLTADCPLIDPDIIRSVASHPDGLDYCTTRGYPRGLGDVERISVNALLEAHRSAEAEFDREHVTPYIRRNDSGRFDAHQILAPRSANRPQLRLCVDELADLQVVRQVYRETRGTRRTTADLIAALDRSPHIAQLNAHVVQRS